MTTEKPGLMNNGCSVAFMNLVVGAMMLRHANALPNEDIYTRIQIILKQPDIVSSPADMQEFSQWVLECEGRFSELERWQLHSLFPSLFWLALAA